MRNGLCHSALRAPHSKLGNPRSWRSGFTLIEMMMVIGLIAIILTIGIPSFVRAQNKGPMRTVTSELLEALNTARAQAIIRGVVVELHVNPQEYTFDVRATTVATEGSSGSSAGGADQRRGFFHVQLHEDVGIEDIFVNFKSFKDSELAVTRFFSNGTAEEFTVIVRSLSGEVRRIFVDPITGRADFARLN